MIYPSTEIEIFAEGLDHPECMVVGSDGAIYAGGEAGQIYRIDPLIRQPVQYASTGGFCLGLAEDPAGRIVICDCKRRAVLVAHQDGRTETLAEGYAGSAFRSPNFGVFDRGGRFYFSDSGDWGAANGVLYRLTRSGTVEVFHEGPFHFPNGLALDSHEQFLYVVESTLHRVLRIAIAADGSPGPMSVFASGLHRVPDGIAFDAEGRLYVTCYASDTLYRCDSSGAEHVLCHDPDATRLNRPTNCAFHEGGLLVANLGGDHLAKLHLNTAGQRLAHQAR